MKHLLVRETLYEIKFSNIVPHTIGKLRLSAFQWCVSRNRLFESISRNRHICVLNHQILPFIQIIFLADPCCTTEIMQLFGKSMQGWDGLGSVVAVYDQITVNKGEKI